VLEPFLALRGCIVSCSFTYSWEEGRSEDRKTSISLYTGAYSSARREKVKAASENRWSRHPGTHLFVVGATAAGAAAAAIVQWDNTTVVIGVSVDVTH